MPAENDIPGQSVTGNVLPPEPDEKTDERTPDEDVTPDPTAVSAMDSPPTSDTPKEAVPSADGPTTDGTPDEHRFRVMVQTHNPGNPVPHSVTTTEDMLLEDAIKFLARHVDDLPSLIDMLEGLL
jgi:hypothetical protein